MGWLFMSHGSMGGHRTAKAYLDAQLSYDRDVDGTTTRMRVLGSSCPGNRVYYAAVQRSIGDQAEPPFAVICLVRWNPRSPSNEHFGYKDMSETSGPCEDECPQSILALLGPTDNAVALDWRRRCLKNLRRTARGLRDGDRVKFAHALSFSNGHKGDEFIVQKQGAKVRFLDPHSRVRYRINNFNRLAWSLLPTTRIHPTMFRKDASTIEY